MAAMTEQLTHSIEEEDERLQPEGRALNKDGIRVGNVFKNMLVISIGFL
jgi:hypothetical protein